MPYINTNLELEEILSNPVLIILVGNIGTGKTTISKYLKHIMNSPCYLSGDELNHEIPTSQMFGHIYLETTSCLSNGKSVIIDGRNLKDADRQKTISSALKRKIPVLFVDCGKGTHKDLQRRLDDNRNIPKYSWKKDFEENQIEYEEPKQMSENVFIIKKETIYTFEKFCKFLNFRDYNIT